MDKGRNNGRTPLCYAARKGHGKVVAALLKGGCVVDKTDDGAMPLLVAAETGRRRVVAALIKGGCNVDKAKNIITAAGNRVDGVEAG